MTKKDIVRKLTSRKLWLAVAGFVSMLIIALGVAETTATQVAAIIMAGADVLAYVLAEGFADAANSPSNVYNVNGPTVNEPTE